MEILNWINTDQCAFPAFFSVSSIRLYYLHDGRNAWWSTWVQRYGQDCMFASMSMACEQAEHRRVQGSVFYILEVPALLFLGPGFNMAIAEINTDCPLGKVITLPKTPYMQDVFEALNPSRPNSVLRLSCSIDEMRLAQELEGNPSFDVYQSYSEGRYYRLGWSRRGNDKVRVDGVSSICDKMKSLLSTWPVFGWKMTPAKEGFVIDPLQWGPAVTVGLEKGDVICRIRDKESGKIIEHRDGFPCGITSGSLLELTVRRGGRTKRVDLVPSSPAEFFLSTSFWIHEGLPLNVAWG